MIIKWLLRCIQHPLLLNIIRVKLFNYVFNIKSPFGNICPSNICPHVWSNITGKKFSFPVYVSTLQTVFQHLLEFSKIFVFRYVNLHLRVLEMPKCIKKSAFLIAGLHIVLLLTFSFWLCRLGPLTGRCSPDWRCLWAQGLWSARGKSRVSLLQDLLCETPSSTAWRRSKRAWRVSRRNKGTKWHPTSLGMNSQSYQLTEHVDTNGGRSTRLMCVSKSTCVAVQQYKITSRNSLL